MTYRARQQPPQASQTCFRATAARRRTTSLSLYGIRGTGTPNKSLAFPTPFREQASSDCRQFFPLSSTRYDSIAFPPTCYPRFGIDAVISQIRNHKCDASPENFPTWKTASISYAYVHKETCATNPPAHTGDSRDVTLRSEPRLSPFFFPDASFPAASGGVSSAKQKRSDANGVVRDCTHSSLKSDPPPHLQEKRQRVNAASCHARRDKARRAVNEVAA